MDDCAKIIDGKIVSMEVKSRVKAEVESLRRIGIEPCLAVILVGEDPASVSYVAGKRKALLDAGMKDRSIVLPCTISESELVECIQELNNDASVHGILVQLPLPSHINQYRIMQSISPSKDVDGFHPDNIAGLFNDLDCFVPCTPAGICVLLKSIGIKTDGARVVIVGRSCIVGRPLALLLVRKEYNATVTVCHTATKNLCEITRQADILIVASGHAGTITSDMIKDGAVVIDVGVNRVEDSTRKSGYRLVGDVDFEGAKKVAGYITPVPGGVGPMTIAMLMENTLIAAKKAAGLEC